MASGWWTTDRPPLPITGWWADAPVTVVPGGATLTVTGASPVVRLTNNVITPSPALLTLTGARPVVVNPRTVTPAGVGLSLTGGTPTVTVTRTVTPNPAALSLTGAAPTVSTPVIVTPAGAVLTVVGSHPALGLTLRPGGAPVAITGATPVVTASNNKIVTPAAAALALTGGTPPVLTPRLAVPAGGALSITGGTPTISVVSLGPAFDAVGAGSISVSSSTSASWNQTASSGDYVLAFVACTGTISSVTYGGVAMTQLANEGFGGNNFYVYGLAGASGGTQTVTATSSSSSFWAANSVSISGVSSVGTPAKVGLAASQSVSLGTGKLIVQSFQDVGNASITAFSGGTGRYDGLHAGFSGALTISTATASTTFTITDSNASTSASSYGIVIS